MNKLKISNQIRYLGIIFLLLLAVGCSSKNTFDINKTDAYIKDIENNLSTYKTCEKDIYGLSTEGGHVIAYFDKNNLTKLEYEYFGEMGKGKKNFYLLGGSIIFANIIEIEYDKPMYIGDSAVKSTSSSKFYFQGKSIAYWSKDEIVIDQGSKEFEIKNSNLQKEISSLDLSDKGNNEYCK
jgi:hypothetical protein